MAAALAVVAGSEPFTAGLVGAGMTSLQFGIGATNDVLDAPRDALSKPRKPIPAGLVEPRTAVLVAAGWFVVGLATSAVLGPAALLTGAAIACVGLAYDVGLKGTAWSWLGFAAGIPLLPVYAWLGATGELPLVLWLLVPAAVAAGAALSVANALVDVERDQASGADSVARRLGRRRSATVLWLLHGGIGLTALSSLAILGFSGRAFVTVGAGIALVSAGVILSAADEPARRERGWQLQAVGVGVLAVGWLDAVISAPDP